VATYLGYNSLPAAFHSRGDESVVWAKGGVMSYLAYIILLGDLSRGGHNKESRWG